MPETDVDLEALWHMDTVDEPELTQGNPCDGIQRINAGTCPNEAVVEVTWQQCVCGGRKPRRYCMSCYEKFPYMKHGNANVRTAMCVKCKINIIMLHVGPAR